MRDEQRGQTHDAVGQKIGVGREALVCHEEQHQRDTGNDLRVDHRDIGDVGDHKAALAAHGRNPQRSRCAEDGSDDRRSQRHFQRDGQRPQDGSVMEQAGVPLERKAGEQRVALALVEAEHDHIRDGQIHEAEKQDDIDPLHQAKMFCFHQDTPSISSSSKLEVKLMQSRTMIINTRLIAEPTFRL